MYKLDEPGIKEFPVMLDIWESSVRATHHFLKEKDIEFFKRVIQEKEVFSHVKLFCARDKNGSMIGFLGVSEDNLEMLFIHAGHIGKGAGRMLLLHAINDLGIKKVDVNEQNEQALAFYERFGFKTISRSDFDGTGKPYPILHMQLISRPGL
jgi:putative acetyltransferase